VIRDSGRQWLWRIVPLREAFGKHDADSPNYRDSLLASPPHPARGGIAATAVWQDVYGPARSSWQKLGADGLGSMRASSAIPTMD